MCLLLGMIHNGKPIGIGNAHVVVAVVGVLGVGVLLQRLVQVIDGLLRAEQQFGGRRPALQMHENGKRFHCSWVPLHPCFIKKKHSMFSLNSDFLFIFFILKIKLQ